MFIKDTGRHISSSSSLETERYFDNSTRAAKARVKYGYKEAYIASYALQVLYVVPSMNEEVGMEFDKLKNKRQKTKTN